MTGYTLEVDEPAAGRWYAQAEFPWGAPGFPEPHFDLGCTMYLPRVLEEPVDGPEEEENP